MGKTAVRHRVRRGLPLKLVRLSKGGYFGQIKMQARRDRVHTLRSEMPDNAAAGENIVLTTFARVHIQLRHTRPEVSALTA
jgi:hypothetical protein